MATSQYLLLVLTLSASILASTVDVGTSLISQVAADDTLPLSLVNLTTQDRPFNQSLTARPPMRWDYINHGYNVSVYRMPITWDRRHENRGVSLFNWRGGITDISAALEKDREDAHLTMFDPIPFGRFYAAVFLLKQKGGNTRQLVFDLLGQGGLSYAEANHILQVLLLWELEWKTGPDGTKNDQVRMCRFELRVSDGQQELLANGTVRARDRPE